MNKIPTVKEITNTCKGYLKQYWNESLDTKILIDGRLKNSLGYFRHSGDFPGVVSSIVCIKFSKDLFMYYSEEEIKKVLLHELTHYVLYKRGIKEYHDGEKTFENEIKRIDSMSTNKIPFHGKVYKVYCPHCNKVIGNTTSKRNATKVINNYLCKCNSSLEIAEYIK